MMQWFIGDLGFQVSVSWIHVGLRIKNSYMEFATILGDFSGSLFAAIIGMTTLVNVGFYGAPELSPRRC